MRIARSHLLLPLIAVGAVLAPLSIPSSALAAPPLATTGLASPVTQASTTLNGSVNPSGQAIADCHFEYVAGPLYHLDQVDEIQTVTITGATGGEFTLSFKGQTSTPILFDATATELETALASLSTVGSGNLKVTGPTGGPYALEFQAALGHADLPQLAGDATSLTPPGAAVEIATETQGDDGYGEAADVPCEHPDAAELGTSVKAIAVHAELHGLATGHYHFRLRITNAASETATGADGTFGTIHLFSTAFSGAGSDAMASPSTLAVDQSSGDVYVSDPLNFRVEKFDPSGNFILMIGKAVNKTAVETPGSNEAQQNLCTAASGDSCQAGSHGSSPGAFLVTSAIPAGPFNGNGEPAEEPGPSLFLAVDNSVAGTGDLYVGDPGDGLVSKFDPSGQLIASWGTDGQLGDSPAGPFKSVARLEAIATDPSGVLYVIGNSHIFKFTAEGSFISYRAGEEFLGPQSYFAVDDGGNFYGEMRGFGNRIAELSPTGQEIGTVTSGSPGTYPEGIAINPATHELYVPLEGGEVDLFPPSCEPLPAFACSPVDAFGAGELSNTLEPRGIALDDASGTVYVADAAQHRIAVFTAVPYLPHATASAASPTESSETLEGVADPAEAGPLSGCRFEYTRIANEVQTLTLAAAAGSGDLTRSSRQVTNLSNASGSFAPGEPIEGEGIPAGTIITAAGPSSLTLSNAATASQTSVALRGQPAGGTYTLSFEGNTTESIPADAPSGELKRKITRFPGVSTENFAVRGDPGGPYEIEFTGTQSFTDFAQFTADPSGLEPAGSLATLATLTQGNHDWGGATTPACEPDPSGATSPTQVSAEASGLEYGTTYHFRLSAENANGSSASFPQTFTTLPLAPLLSGETAGPIETDTAELHARLNPNGGGDAFHSSYRVEYVSESQFQESGFAAAQQSPGADAGSARTAQPVAVRLTGLSPGTVYRYRFLAENAAGLTEGPLRTFTTLPFNPPLEDPCPNAHVRQQTGTALLPDCRAYELVSAANAGGYDVESDLIAGQRPFASFPRADERVLYGVHDGGIPGTGEPTNRGVDPYLATRSATGWHTKYVGIPAHGTPSAQPFSSSLLATDPGLDTFAFGGPEICAPCFSTGIETGIPLRLPTGELTQGMTGSVEPEPSATDDGFVARPFSTDGSHFVFSSSATFEPAAANNHGNVSIYDHNLRTGETHVVSKNPKGAKLECLQGTGNCHAPGDANGIAELDISSDGSRILLAQKVSEDSAGNVYWHLFMNLGDSTRSIDLTPGASDGVLYDGMSADGSRVFFTTKDQSLPSGATSAANLYEVEVSEAAGPPQLLAAGEGSCAPLANENGPHWNSLEALPSCNPVAITGSGGVAAGQGVGSPGEGTIYFLSPLQLQAGHGVENQPNLYLAAPGQPPRFIATLSPSDRLVIDSVKASGIRRTTDFQVSPSGNYIVFPSQLPLTPEAETAGFADLYRYDAASEALDCVSCVPSGAASGSDSQLASDGLSLSDDGRVFFTTKDQLAATDTDNRPDAYEWEAPGAGNCGGASPAYNQVADACLALISTGTSSFDSGLLGISANATDAYFFTRDSLVPSDENGPTMKIYDARVEGGFAFEFPSVPCKASDECHGPSSAPPAPLGLGSESGTPHNFQEEPEAKRCRHGFVMRHGKCVKRRHPHKHKHRHRRGGKK